MLTLQAYWFPFGSWVALKRCFLLSVLSRQQVVVSPTLQQNWDTWAQGSSRNMALGLPAHLWQLQHCGATGIGLKHNHSYLICNLKIHFLSQKYIFLIQDEIRSCTDSNIFFPEISGLTASSFSLPQGLCTRLLKYLVPICTPTWCLNFKISAHQTCYQSLILPWMSESLIISSCLTIKDCLL